MRHWNPNEPQLLWADDAFGVMNLNPTLMDPWNRTLSNVRAIVHNRGRVVLTSRDYIWRAARRQLKESAFPFLVEERVTIDVTSFSRDEKEQILYAHLRARRQPPEYRTAAKPHLRSVCAVIDLLPETARRFADPFFTGSIDPSSPRDVERFLSNPKGYLQEILEKLDAPHEAAVALVFAHAGRLPYPLAETPGDERLIREFGASSTAVRQALGDLRGTLLRADTVNGWYGFRHPSIGDAYAELLSRQPERLAIWLQGAPLGQIMSEATVDVDDPDLPGVAIPPSLYPHLSGRLDGVDANGEDTALVLTFLADRCSAEFARAYLGARPDLLRPLTRPRLYVYAFDPALVLLNLLHDRGILPEPARREFAEGIALYAIEGPDPAWCSIDDVQGLLTHSERSAIRQSVRNALVTDNARELAAAWDTINYPGTDWGSPESYVEPLHNAISAMRVEFADDNDALQALHVLERHAEQLEQELNEHHPEYDVDDARLRKSQSPPQPRAQPPRRASERDPFDDVDS